MKIKSCHISETSVFTILLIIMQLTSVINIPIFLKNNSSKANYEIFNKEKESSIENSYIDEKNAKPSNILYHKEKYNLSNWWNSSFRYRIGFKLENIDSFDRYQPIDVYFTFRENEHYKDTCRLVSYNSSGNNQWSEPIPIQIWNIEKYQSTNYIKSCIITFLANISANSNSTYFLYFNDNNEEINNIQYDTDFSSILLNGKLNVSGGTYNSKYQIILEEGKGVSKLIRNNINFHSSNSLSPERQLNHPSLKLLTHCDEGEGTGINDASTDSLEGDFVGDVSWTGGIINNGVKFDGDSDYITFNDVLNNPFGSSNNKFTISTWIKPKGFSSLKSIHKTMNCFMAKASKPYNDNLELGIYRINETHGLLNVYIGTAGFHNQSIFGDISNPIRTNQWNFIAVRYNEGNVDVRINDLWYTKDVNNSEPWEGGNYLDQASGSYFTLGGTINSEIYFNGSMDEIAIYNINLTNFEIEKSKLGYINSSIKSIVELENGDIFSKYQIKWNTIYDMHIEDIITFYYNYNLWNIYRTIYLDNSLDQNKVLMTVMNTNYNLTDISDHQKCKYIYDGIIKKDLTSTDFIFENYSIIYCPTDPLKNTFGLIIEGYNVSNISQSSISYLKGNVNYTNNLVKFTPGSINDFNNSDGGVNYKLIVNSWEYIDSINQTGNLDNAGISQYFNNMYNSLKNSIIIHLFYQNSLKVDLEIYIEDIDQNPVNGATVYIYNLTSEGKVDTCIATKKSDNNGKAIFQKMLNGTYKVNITYANYNQPAFQIISKPVSIAIDDNLADINDKIYYNFYNVSLTTLNLILQRVDPETKKVKESVINANISFWINDGSGDKYIGYELTDELGKTEFHWQNFTSTADGNITFSITWYDTLQKISAEGDLNIGNNKKITLSFYKEITAIINVSTYEFSCALVEYILDPAKFGDILTFKVNYTYTINYSNPEPIINAKVYSYIEENGVNISSILLKFSDIGLNGTYEVKMDTSNPIDPEIEFKPNIIYSMIIIANKPGYIPKITTILFELSQLKTNLICEETELDVYWGNYIMLNVSFEDITNLPFKGIGGANITYIIIENPEINGTLQPDGNVGLYNLNLSSINLIIDSIYNLNITAIKRGYETKIISINLKILIRPTLLNGESNLQQKTYNFYYGDVLNFSFSYKDEILNEDIIDLDEQSYAWKEYNINGLFVRSGEGELILNKKNLYILDFDTEKRNIGRYELDIKLNKENYEPKSTLIIFKIHKRIFDYKLSKNFVDNETRIVKGETLKIEIELIDLTRQNLPLSDANVELLIEGKKYVFNEVSPGKYECEFSTEEYNTILRSIELEGEIEISKEGYNSIEIEITIIIKLEEIIPGLPILHFSLFITIIISVLGILIALKYYKHVLTPKFIKNIKLIKKAIKKRKIIELDFTDYLKEKYILKKYKKDWETIGLSLEDILKSSTKSIIETD